MLILWLGNRTRPAFFHNKWFGPSKPILIDSTVEAGCSDSSRLMLSFCVWVVLWKMKRYLTHWCWVNGHHFADNISKCKFNLILFPRDHLPIIRIGFVTCSGLALAGQSITGITLHMRLANERLRYIGTSSLIGWAHIQNNLCHYRFIDLVMRVNPLHAKLFSRNRNAFLSFFHTDMSQVVEILYHGRQGLTYFTMSILWVLMTWGYKEPGLQQPWYQPSKTRITWSLHIKSWVYSSYMELRWRTIYDLKLAHYWI